jgi:hypothetical protein
MTLGPISNAVALLKPSRVHVYTQAWWGSKSHINIGYLSSDPLIIRRQLDSCQRVLSPAKVAMVPDWYGPHDTLGENYCQGLREECEQMGVEFSMMIDKGAMAKSTFPELLAYLRLNYFRSLAYSKVQGKYIVWQFGVKGIDPASVPSDVLLVSENSSDSGASYAWPNGFAPNTPAKYLAGYLKRTDKFMVPCLWKGFDDHKKSKPTESVWGGPARVMNSGPTGWELWDSLVETIQATGHAFPELGLATLNDFEERTRLEPFILQEWSKAITNDAAALLNAN